MRGLPISGEGDDYFWVDELLIRRLTARRPNAS